jgi:hypothetical protein
VRFVWGLIFWLTISAMFFLTTGLIGSILLWMSLGFRPPFLWILRNVLF